MYYEKRGGAGATTTVGPVTSNGNVTSATVTLYVPDMMTDVPSACTSAAVAAVSSTVMVVVVPAAMDDARA